MLRFMISMSIGMTIANSRLTLRLVSIRSRLASSNRSSSCFVRTNARMTRTPGQRLAHHEVDPVELLLDLA